MFNAIGEVSAHSAPIRVGGAEKSALQHCGRLSFHFLDIFAYKPVSMEVSKQDHALIFVDSSPSELIHSLGDKILIISLINFLDVALDEVKIRQFKDTRTIERKLAAQKYVIECFETRKLVGYGVINWNSQRLAMQNAQVFVVDQGYAKPEDLEMDNRIEVAGENVSIGHFLSLAWYSIVLARNFSHVAYMTTFEKKKKAMILLDLLPGDGIGRSRNLNILKHLIRHTILDGLFADAVRQNDLKGMGFGYGSIEGSTQDLKNQPHLCVVDWITHSFYARLRCEKIVRDERYDELLPHAGLANYLVDKGFFKVTAPFRLTGG